MLGQTRIIRVCPNMALPIRQNYISLNVVKEKQFKEIFEALYPKVYGFALKALDQEWLAEEIAHTSFCKLWTHRNNLEIKEKDVSDSLPLVSGYLFVITRNEINNYFRDRAQIEEYRAAFVSQMCVETRIEQRIDAATALEIVDRTVEAMPSVRREVISLSRFHNLSNDQIARKLGISKRTVEKHIQLALSQLRMELLAYQV